MISYMLTSVNVDVHLALFHDSDLQTPACVSDHMTWKTCQLFRAIVSRPTYCCLNETSTCDDIELRTFNECKIHLLKFGHESNS
jgi:hypothetical protein